MLTATWKKNNKKAAVLIIGFSVFVFIAVSVLSGSAHKINPGFNPHIFAKAGAAINAMVSVLLLGGLAAVKNRRYLLHKRIMLTAVFLSVIFLVCYICHHLFAPESRYGDINHDGLLSAAEKMKAGNARYVYYFILGTHIPLAGIVLPFVLFAAYRALTGEFEKHKKLVRITWPLWFYVAITGVAVYIMISPYYSWPE